MPIEDGPQLTVDQLGRLRGAAAVAGISGETLTKSMESLGDALQGAKFGRNPEALIMLNRSAVEWHA